MAVSLTRFSPPSFFLFFPFLFFFLFFFWIMNNILFCSPAVALNSRCIFSRFIGCREIECESCSFVIGTSFSPGEPEVAASLDSDVLFDLTYTNDLFLQRSFSFT